MKNNGIKMRPTNIVLEPGLFKAASQYAASLPDPLSFGALVRHLLRSTPGINAIMKLKKKG
jgi:hypothetical protein